MIGRPFRMAWHEQDTPEALKEACQSQRDVYIRTRLHALWLIRRGWQIKAAAEAVGVHCRSAQRWVGWYREGGLDEVLSRKMGGVGQPRFLSESQERRLVGEIGSGRFRTAGEIADWVESEYGVRFTRGTAYTVCLSGWDVHRRFPDPGMRRRTCTLRSGGKRGAWPFPSESGS